MLSEAVWICLLSHVQSPREFWHMSKVCKASAVASRQVRHSVASRFQKLNVYGWGWSHFINNTNALLHGSRGVFEEHTGFFRVTNYALGQPVRGRRFTVVPYREPADLKPSIIKQLRMVSDNHTRSAWHRWRSRLPHTHREKVSADPPPRSTLRDVQRLIEQIAQ
jgi:hypothetical protein